MKIRKMHDMVPFLISYHIILCRTCRNKKYIYIDMAIESTRTNVLLHVLNFVYEQH